jgi:localization factor PodJL
MADLDGRAAIMRNEPGSRTPARSRRHHNGTLGSDTIPGKASSPAQEIDVLVWRAFRAEEADGPSLAGSAPDDDIPTVDLDEPLDEARNRPLERLRRARPQCHHEACA